MPSTRFRNDGPLFARFCVGLLAAGAGIRGSSAQSSWTAVSRGSDTLIVTARFPAPAVMDSSGSERVVLGRPVTFLLECEGSDPVLAEEKRSLHSTVDGGPFRWAEDAVLNGKAAADPSSPPERPSSIVLSDLGRTGNRRLFSVSLNPDSDPSDARRGRWVESITVRCAGTRVLPVRDGSFGAGWKPPARPVASVLKPAAGAAASILEGPCVQIRYGVEGLYYLPQSFVVNAGWNVSGLDPRHLRIIGPEGEIPIRVIGEEDGSFDFTDGVEFYGKWQWNTAKTGEKRLNPFTTDNVLWLVLGDRPGARFSEQKVVIPPTDGSVSFPRSYPWTEHIESDQFFSRLPNNAIETMDDAEYWLMTDGPRGGQSLNLTFTLPRPDLYAAQTASMRIKFQGQTSGSDIQPVDFLVNNHVILSAEWMDNAAYLQQTGGFSPSYLLEGANTLTVVNRSGDGERSVVAVDWFELTYPSLYRSDGNSIRFKPPLYSAGTLCPFRIDGFESPDIELFKSGAGRLSGFRTVLTTDSLGRSGYSIYFEDWVADESAEYFAVTTAGKLTPDTVAFMPAAVLRVPGRGADILVVTPSDSLGRDALRNWTALREGQGYKVAIVNLDSIYAEFNYGIPDPSALREFFRYARAEWNPAPRFVMLVGDGATDYRRPFIGPHTVPSPLFHSVKYGGAASDYWYTLLDDGKPELAIGRLPVRSRAELEAVVAKILEYETAPAAPWKNTYLMIDGGRTSDVFASQIQSLIMESIPHSLHAERLYRVGDPWNAEIGGREKLLDYMDRGVAWINFRGHGGGGIWADGDPSMMTLDDVDSLANKGKYPVVTSLTCYTGDFTSSRDCLGEAMIRKPEAGAVAFLGTTSVGWTNADFVLMQNILTVFRSRPDLTLGELVQRGKSLYRLQNSTDLAESEIHQYNLLGDPSLRFAFPPESADFNLTASSIGMDDSVRFVWNGSVRPAQAHVEVVDSTFRTRSLAEINLPSGPLSAAVPLPPDVRSGPAGLRIYSWDESAGLQSRSYRSFAVESSHFDSVWTDPAEPRSSDSIGIHVRLFDRSPVRRVLCEVELPAADSLLMTWNEAAGEFAGIRRIGPFDPGSIVRFRIRVESEAGSTSGIWMIRTIPTLADLSVSGIGLGGGSNVRVQAVVLNGGQTDVTALPVRFDCSELGWSRDDTVDVPAGRSVTAGADWDSRIGAYLFRVSVNPDRSIAESRTDNNRVSQRITVKFFRVSPELGSMDGSDGPRPVGFESIGAVRSVRCLIPPGSVAASSVLSVQSELAWVKGQAAGEEPSLLVHHFSLSNAAEDAPLPVSIQLTFVLIDSLVLEGFRPYRWNEDIGEWISVPFSTADSTVTLTTLTLGRYAFMPNLDGIPPRIEIEMEDQIFSDGGFVPAHPRFSILIEDSSGVDSRSEALEVVLDENRRQDYAWLPSDSALANRSRRIRFEPELDSGEHTLRITASDLHGNTARTETVRFVVEGRFDLKFLGNHPNPFRRETVFAYQLTLRADRLILKVYTVAGKLIRVFDDGSMAAPDYHEITWDGTDDWGEPVANGVYFFRMTAVQGSVRREITGKIARTR
jgi:hypothetical protein